MKYTYAYKTSDGTRHEAAMDAGSREAVFEALRARGIRAIKVVAADGSKANGEIRGVRKRIVVAVSTAAAVLAGGAVYFLAPEQPQEEQKPSVAQKIAFTSEEYRAAFTNLEAQAADIVSRHHSAIESLELDILGDYKHIEAAVDTADLDRKVRLGYRAVDDSRMEVRNLFKSIFTMFPADCKVEREEAQGLYAETMDKLDASERRIVKDEKAMRLLVGNRGKWRCAGGKVVWGDATLANEFEYFRRGARPAR